MGVGKTILIIFLSFIIVILLLFISIGLFAYSLLYPSIYLKTLDSSKTYDYIEQNLDSNPRATFIKIPEEGLKPIIESILINTSKYLRSESDELTLTVEIDKEKLRNFFIQNAENFAICPNGQDPFEGEEAKCRPRNQTAEEFLDEVLTRKDLNFFWEDSVDLTDVYGVEENSEGRENLDKLRNSIKTYKISLIILGFILFLIIFFIFLLKKDSKKSFLRIIGIDITIVSILLISLAFTLKGYYPHLDINLDTNEGILIKNILDTLVTILIKRINIFGIILASIGIIFFIIPFFIKDKKSNVKNKKK